MTAQLDLNTRISAILAGLAAADTRADAEHGEFRLRQDERGHVIGDFYKCRLGSVFQPVFSATGRRVMGHEARVRCEGWGDEAVSPWGIFSRMASDSALVRLDRLCRTLHMLNYFGRARSGDLKLFVRVEPRLLTSVKQDHGKVFGEALGHCGVATSRVVIEIPVEAVGDRDLLQHAVTNYRARGYGIAANYPARSDAGTFDEVKPDFLKIEIKRLNADQALAQIISRTHAWGGRVIASKIETARDLVVAT